MKLLLLEEWEIPDQSGPPFYVYIEAIENVFRVCIA